MANYQIAGSRNGNIFAEVQDRYTVKEIAEQLGIRLHRVGSDERANSIFGDGDEGKDAFAVYQKSNTWYDFMERKGGDVTDLVAVVKFNGDRGAALRELMPEWTPEKVKIQVSERQEFMKTIERWHTDLFNPNKQASFRALAYLHSRKITDETIKALKIGIMPMGSTYRIVFPYWDESGKNVLYYTSRCYDWSGHGEDPKAQKYMKASLQAHPFLKNSIFGLNTLDRNRDELVITEGVVDWLSFYQEGYSVISPNGGDFGKLMPQVIEKIKRFKAVYLAFDNDEPGKEFTYKMARELIKEKIPFNVIQHNVGKDIADYYSVNGNLQNLLDYACMGAKWCVQQYLAPQKPLQAMTIGEQDRTKKKIKEFILEISPFTDESDMHDIIMSLSGIFDKTWLTKLNRQGTKGLNEMEVCEAVKAHHKLIYNPKIGFFEYSESGIWEEKADEQIHSHIMDVLGQFTTGGKLVSNLRTLKGQKDLWSDVPLNGFNMLPRITFMNGTVHIDDNGKGTLKGFSADDYTTVKLPYRFDAKAAPKKWSKFLKEVTGKNKRAQKILQEFAGYLLLPDCRFQKSLMLMGGGSNGKSVFVNVLSKMLGGSKGYVSYVEPSKLSKDFRLMPFKNSWLNISADAESDLRGAEGVFKRIVAGENLEDSFKYKAPFAFPTRSKMVMCCNNYPTVSDTSEGFMRRFLIVEFPMRYVDPDKVRPDTKDRPLDINLEQELLKELPGIFNWALEGLQRLLAQGQFTKTKDQEKLINGFVRANNHLMSFAEDFEEGFFEEVPEDKTVKKGKTVKKRQIFENYKRWAEKRLENSTSAGKFYVALIAIFARLGWEFTEENNSWTFKDIQLAGFENDDDDDDENSDFESYAQDADEHDEQIEELVAGI